MAMIADDLTDQSPISICVPAPDIGMPLEIRRAPYLQPTVYWPQEPWGKLRYIVSTNDIARDLQFERLDLQAWCIYIFDPLPRTREPEVCFIRPGLCNSIWALSCTKLKHRHRNTALRTCSYRRLSTNSLSPDRDDISVLEFTCVASEPWRLFTELKRRLKPITVHVNISHWYSECTTPNTQVNSGTEISSLSGDNEFVEIHGTRKKAGDNEDMGRVREGGKGDKRKGQRSVPLHLIYM